MAQEIRENPARPEGAAGAQMLDRMNQSHAPLRRWGLPHIEWTPGMRILDAGCGGGATIAEMFAYAKDAMIDGVDYSDVSVEASRKLNKERLGHRCEIKKADVTHLPYVDDTFDLVTAVETVYFWPDIAAALREIRRVLKPYGVIAILNEGSDPDTLDWPEIDGFMKIYRPEELTALLREAGFNAIRFYRGAGQEIFVTARK